MSVKQRFIIVTAILLIVGVVIGLSIYALTKPAGYGGVFVQGIITESEDMPVMAYLSSFL